MARAARRTGLDMATELAVWAWTQPFSARLRGGVVAAAGVALIAAFATWNSADPSLNVASALPPTNILRGPGAVVADIFVQSLGLTAWGLALLMVVFGVTRAVDHDPDAHRAQTRLRALVGVLAVLAIAGAVAAPSPPKSWALARGLGGFWGDAVLGGLSGVIGFARIPGAEIIAALILLAVGLVAAHLFGPH